MLSDPNGFLRPIESSDAPQRFLCASPYLVEGVAHRQLPQHSQAEGLSDKVGPQQVGDGFMAIELSVAYPRLGQQPVPLGVTGQEDGAVGPRVLAELRVEKERGLHEGKDTHTRGPPTAGGRPRGM